MGSQETQMTNLQLCVTKLKDFVNNVPKGSGEKVNWEELNQQRNLAEMSLIQLANVFGGNESNDDSLIDRGCFVYPKI